MSDEFFFLNESFWCDAPIYTQSLIYATSFIENEHNIHIHNY